MKGALPPSSSATLLMVELHWPYSVRPTSVEPVNERMATCGAVDGKYFRDDKILFRDDKIFLGTIKYF